MLLLEITNNWIKFGPCLSVYNKSTRAAVVAINGWSLKEITRQNNRNTDKGKPLCVVVCGRSSNPQSPRIGCRIMPTKKSIIDQLQRAIRDCGETEYAIAKGSGVSQSILNRFVSGERGISLESAAKLCDYLVIELSVRRRR